MLGLLAGVDQKDYAIDSNKEAGLGRFDILIAPRQDMKRLGIIIEIKSLRNEAASIDMLQTEASEALDQINEKKYQHSALLQPGQPLLKMGIAFNGKELAVVEQRSSV
jgi:hypothetical protein